MNNSVSIDVEDWFHILGSPQTPKLGEWSDLESRIAANVEKMLNVLDATGVKATFFWLGWAAERNKALLRRCEMCGHEIASHGYGHVLAYEAGRKDFAADVRRGKAILEDIIAKEVLGFRAAGFSATNDSPWTFDEIRAAGHTYDSSVFPANHGHGGMSSSNLGPYTVRTDAGDLVELPQSVVEIFGRRLSLFGGGYLRLAPKPLIKWGIKRLHKAGQPLIVYLHPREIDPDHPRLPLGLVRRFKSYVNLRSTMPKLQWLCQDYDFMTMGELAQMHRSSAMPIKAAVEPPPARKTAA